jgi:hypothetical protein
VLDLIDALEALGADADLVGASPASLDVDMRLLESMLRAQASRCVLIHPAEEEEEDPEEDEEEEGADDEDEDDEDADDEDADDVAPRKGPTPRGS